MEGRETEPAEGEAGRARRSRGLEGAWGTSLPGGGRGGAETREGKAGREAGLGPRRVRMGMAGPARPRWLRQHLRGFSLPSCSPRSAASPVGPGGDPPWSPSSPLGFRGTQGRSRSLRRGEAGRGEGRVLGSKKEQGGGDKGWTSAASPGTAVSPRDSRRPCPRAHTRAQRPARPCSTLRLQPAAQAARTHSTCTLSRLPATPDPQGRARRAEATQRSTHTCAPPRVHTDRGPPRSACRPDALHSRRSLPPPPRVFTQTPRSVTGGGTRGRITPGGAHAREGGAPPGRRPPARPCPDSCPPPRARLRAPALSAPHSLSAPLRLRLRPGLPRGLAGAGWAAEAAAAAGAERAAAGAGTPPSRRQKPPSSGV